MLRCGIIGLGFIGCKAPDNHMKAYEDCEDTELVACCDIDTPYMDMVQGTPLDIVSVCTPPETHCQIVCDIAPYVRAIYCEKPIALTLEDADRMIETCYHYGTLLQINHQRRFVNPKFRFSRGILNTGTHMFDLLRYLFGDIQLCKKTVILPNWVLCDIEEVDTDEPVFEFDCTHNKEPMILEGVKHLVQCLRNRRKLISSGEEAREALKLCLEYKEMNE